MVIECSYSPCNHARRPSELDYKLSQALTKLNQQHLEELRGILGIERHEVDSVLHVTMQEQS